MFILEVQFLKLLILYNSFVNVYLILGFTAFLVLL